MKKPFPLQPYILKALRRIFGWWPARKACKDAALFQGTLYTCASCQGNFQRKAVAVDHIEPVISVEDGFQGYDEYIKRLFCPIENLQVLCRPCHNKKSKAENALRRKYSARRKKQ